jgi:hypothetical protein
VVFHGIGHSWHAEEESVVITIRWPSIPGYAVPGLSPGAGNGQTAGLGRADGGADAVGDGT